uniref:Uncharacterized protein n=1 Tax=Oryza brachyantha TaxID=4533 RepID=J3KZI4_ORYBR
MSHNGDNLVATMGDEGINPISMGLAMSVEQLEEVREICDTLRLAHEGYARVRESRIKLLEGQLGRFVMKDDETTQQMYDCILATLSHCTKKDHLAHSRSRDGKLQATHSKLLQEDAQHIKSLTKNTTIVKNKEITLKAKAKLKKEDFALVIKTFKKFLKYDGYGKKKHDNRTRTRQSKRVCLSVANTSHFVANWPKKNKEQDGKPEPCKKKSSRHIHIGREWVSQGESYFDDGKGVATIVIKLSTSTEGLFTNLTDNDYYAPTWHNAYFSGETSWVVHRDCTNHITREMCMFKKFI